MDSRISADEKAFIRGFVATGGILRRREGLRILNERAAQSEYFRRLAKDGSELEVSLRIYPSIVEGDEAADWDLATCPWDAPLSPNIFRRLLFGRKVALVLQTNVLADNGSVNELLFCSINEILGSIDIPDLQALFSDKSVRHGDIYLRDSPGENPGGLRCTTYGVVGDTHFISPVKMEELSSDCLVHVVEDDARILGVAIEDGTVSPSLLLHIFPEK